MLLLPTLILWFCAVHRTVLAQDSSTSDATPVSTPASSSATPTDATSSEETITATTSPGSSSASTTTRSSNSSTSGGAISPTVPDVYLNVPTLSVGRIELEVDDLTANLNLKARVAGLVSINAGVALSVEKVNITIADVEAQVELVVRLGHLVDVVNRVFQSLNLNPLLISALNGVSDLVDSVVGAVDGLIGSITQDGNTLDFLVDNLGHIVQKVTTAAGQVTSTIVGDYETNMTYTGKQTNLDSGYTQRTYSYEPLNSLVDIVFNGLGQIVQATVQGSGNNGTGTSSTAAAKRKI